MLKVGRVEFDGDEKFLADLVANGLDGVDEDAGSVLQRPSVPLIGRWDRWCDESSGTSHVARFMFDKEHEPVSRVDALCAIVGPRVEEAREQVPMSRVELYAVKPRLLADCRGVGESLDHVFALLHGQRSSFWSVQVGEKGVRNCMCSGELPFSQTATHAR